MDLNETLSQLTSLPVADRLRLVESLWDSIEADTPVSLSTERREELERRLAAHEAHPEDSLSWEQVVEKLHMSNK